METARHTANYEVKDRMHKTFRVTLKEFFRFFVMIKDEYFFCHWYVVMNAYQNARGALHIHDNRGMRADSQISDRGVVKKLNVSCSAEGLKHLTRYMVSHIFISCCHLFLS